jgi:UDP-glucuronate 4-epimerase
MTTTQQKKILVTGAAGFIGYHLIQRLSQAGHQVIGIDNLNNYYDVRLKLDRLAVAGIDIRQVAYKEPVPSGTHANYTFIQVGIEDAANLERIFSQHQFDLVCHLAAQAGVRYSIRHPEAYIQSNIVGFFNILESSRHHGIRHLVYASSSSVYGNTDQVPFRTTDPTDQPISFYAATKKSNELMAYTYSHLFGLPCTGLRFFTVYGPWGRPDMAYSLFAKAILEGRPLPVFNEGKLSRDFTYVDDIVEGIIRILQDGPKGPNQVYNIGNNQPTELLTFIREIENALGRTAKLELLPMQPGDVETTYADVDDLIRDYQYQPQTQLADGIRQFVNWYRTYHRT